MNSLESLIRDCLKTAVQTVWSLWEKEGNDTSKSELALMATSIFDEELTRMRVDKKISPDPRNQKNPLNWDDLFTEHVEENKENKDDSFGISGGILVDSQGNNEAEPNHTKVLVKPVQIKNPQYFKKQSRGKHSSNKKIEEESLGKFKITQKEEDLFPAIRKTRPCHLK